MRDLLPAMMADVGQDAVARRIQLQLPGDAADRTEEAGHLGIASLRGEVGQRDIAAARDHQHVHRRFWGDVVEGHRPFVLIDPARRDFAAQDAGEDVLVVVGSLAAYRHRRSS